MGMRHRVYGKDWPTVAVCGDWRVVEDFDGINWEIQHLKSGKGATRFIAVAVVSRRDSLIAQWRLLTGDPAHSLRALPKVCAGPA